MNNSVMIKCFLSIITISAGLTFSTQWAYATVADGVYAYEKGNYQQARTEWLPYAALGNPNALYNLGQLSRMGRGVGKNYIKAEEYYLRAAEKGHVGAQRNLGTLYYFGRTGQVDHKKAFNWLLKAAINGDAKSQLMAGTMYFNGESGEKNNLQAYAWITLAAKSGLKNAAAALEKLNAVMTADQISQAEKLVPGMISRRLSPDDVGLMVNQRDAAAQSVPLLNTPKPEKIEPEVPEVAAAAPDAADNFRIQLGSFRTEDAAQETLTDLEGKLSHLLEGHRGTVEFADLGKKGIYYRLQLRPFGTRSKASDLCSLLKENGQNCYVIKVP